MYTPKYSGTSARSNPIPQIRVQRMNSSRPMLERRLCIETILKDICMEHLEELFAKEEVGSVLVKNYP